LSSQTAANLLRASVAAVMVTVAANLSPVSAMVVAVAANLSPVFALVVTAVADC
jgi:hypothetical protein